MTVLGRERIVQLLSAADPARRLVVTPILEPDAQIGDGCIDVRIGNYFIVTKSARVGGIEPFTKRSPTSIERYQETLYVGFGSALWIHPGTFVLGGTLEYVRLPANLYADVTARSSWARLGLSIACAVAIHPKFYGCLTLELVNNGNTPVAVHPGDRIGQLTLYDVEPAAAVDASEEGKYLGQIVPGYAQLEKEAEERSKWAGLGRQLRSIPRRRRRTAK